MKRFSWHFAVFSITLLVSAFSLPAQARIAAPSHFSATVQTGSRGPFVHLTWGAVSGAFYYKAFRDGGIIEYTRTLSFDDMHVAAGQTHTYMVSVVPVRGSESLPSAAVTVTLPPLPPPAPSGLQAVSHWVTNCPLCGMPMAHIMLSWTAAPRAQTYTVYRNGTLLVAGLMTPSDTDMAVTSGKSYSYTVAAIGAGGTSPQSAAATVTASDPPVTAPPTPMPGMTTQAPPTPMPGMSSLTPPTNLAVHGVWQGGSTDILTWDAVPGAASYNVYQYDQLLASGVTTTGWTVPLAHFNGSMTYTVTAVDGSGGESIPSAIAQAAGALDPTQQPSWMPSAPVIPTALTATPEWNVGVPRIRLTWQGSGTDYTYTVYRDGVKLASGLWRLTYLDAAIQSGEIHTYTVTGVNVPWTAAVESAPSTRVTATAPSGPPALSATPIQITQVVPNDDSAVVFFQAVPGAVDYRVYDAAKPGSVKYSGGGLSIQMNGLDPAAGADLVVEAVDKFGPFQKMDGTMGPGTMTMSGMTSSAITSSINGQGDPSDVPNVVARSAPFHVTCQPFTLTGAQSFLDSFRNSQSFAPSTLDPAVASLADGWSEISEVANDKWRIRTYGADMAMSRAFVMGNHFMDTLYDGPTATNHPFSHNNNASLVMIPKATADISGGKVLHVTFEVDAHFDNRRWCDVFVAPAGDDLLMPGKFTDANADPTTSGNMFRWEIQAGVHNAELFLGKDAQGNLVQIPLFDHTNGVGADDFDNAVRHPESNPQLPAYDNQFNGSTPDLDRRHRFDLYLSQTHFRVEETVPGQPTVVVKDETLPNGVTLPFTNCQVYFVHQLYHTGNDRPDLVNYDPADAYWYNDRPWADERHWDNMGFEVLGSFPGQ